MYYYFIEDFYGYKHSIDNTVSIYYLKVSVSKALEILHGIGEKSENYWERLNCSSCPKYSFYQNHIHLENGLYISVGHYSDYDREKKKFRLFPMMKLEVNPNKHSDNSVFFDLLKFVRNDCASGELVKIDYAVDIPVKPDSVQVFKSLKEKGLYKGTRYYGQRNKHGFCRIYDKAKESRLKSPLTRVEHTLEVGSRLSLEKVCVADCAELNKDDYLNLSPNLKVIIDLCMNLKSIGGTYEECLKKLDRRTRYKIEPFLSASYREYQWNPVIIGKLIRKVKELLYIDECERKPDVRIDENGFMDLSDDVNLPFD